MRPYFFSRVIFPSGRAHDRAARLGDEQVGSDQFEQSLPRVEVVRRVGEHDVAVERRRHRHRVGRDHLGAIARSSVSRLSWRALERIPITLDERASIRSARQGFDAHCAAAGEQIGDESTIEHSTAAERVEDRFPAPGRSSAASRCPRAPRSCVRPVLPPLLASRRGYGRARHLVRPSSWQTPMRSGRHCCSHLSSKARPGHLP